MLKVNTASQSMAALVITGAIVLGGCGNGEEILTVRGGAVPLSKVRLGVPQSVFTDAFATFAKDPKGSSGGKAAAAALRLYKVRGHFEIAIMESNIMMTRFLPRGRNDRNAQWEG